MQAVSAIISPAAAAFLYAVWPLNAIILLDIVGAIPVSYTHLDVYKRQLQDRAFSHSVRNNIRTGIKKDRPF